MEILVALWEQGSMNVREIHEAVGVPKGTGYSTTLKMVQVMTAKKLVKRITEKRPQVYRAAVTREDTQRGVVGDLLNRAFGGSLNTLVMRALESNAVNEGELSEIRRLLDQYENGQPSDSNKE